MVTEFSLWWKNPKLRFLIELSPDEQIQAPIWLPNTDNLCTLNLHILISSVLVAGGKARGPEIRGNRVV